MQTTSWSKYQMWIQKARADLILLHDAVSQQQETEKVTRATRSSTRASAYTRRRSCLATTATGPSVAGVLVDLCNRTDQLYKIK